MRKTVSRQLRFVSKPAPDALSKFERLQTRRRFARRPNRKSKLAPYLESIRHCLERSMSLQATSDFLEYFHQMQAKRSTIKRFIERNPILRHGLSGAQVTSAINTPFISDAEE